jgi:MYXO-CTERM domain-containing protein
MLSRIVRLGLLGAVLGVTIGTGGWASRAQAFFPQSNPPFPPHTGVEPQPPIIVPETPLPPVKSTPEPGTMALALVGVGAAFVARRRGKKS